MSKYMDEFMKQHEDTPLIRKQTAQFKKHNPKEAESIRKMLGRFKK